MKDMFSPLRKLLIDACSPVKSPETMSGLRQRLSLTSPDKLRSLADRELLLPLLYHHLKAIGMPGYDRILPQLKDTYMNNTARNVLLLKQLKTIKKQADRDGIRIILLKGAALAMSVYREIGLRPMTDIDILVEKEHVGKIRKIMEHNSMHPLSDTINQGWFSNVKAHIVPFKTDDNILSLEVHTRLLDDRFIHFAGIDPFQNNGTIQWDSENFAVLDPFTAFLYALYHMTLHHNFSFMLRDVVDLPYLISFYNIEPGKIVSYVGSTDAAGLFLPLVRTAFALSGIAPFQSTGAKSGHAYLYWTNSVLMKYIPIQVSSRLSDPSLRIMTALTSGIKKWLPRIFRFTDYEISLFYRSQKKGGRVKKAVMSLWVAAVCVPYLLIFLLFSIIPRKEKV